jgi:hypothetical protein
VRSQKKPRKDEDDSDKDEVDDDEEMSDVERDIAEAMRKAEETNAISKLSLLHSVSWFRVILDEAHMIKGFSMCYPDYTVDYVLCASM